MQRKQLEHIIRAAGDIAKIDSLLIFGSQSILAQYPEIAEKEWFHTTEEKNSSVVLSRSMEADICVPSSPEKTDMIDGAIGELSTFHETYGYYAQAVSEETSILPIGWRDRLVCINTPNTKGVKGFCLEIHDLLIAKLVANRPKDLEFFAAAVYLRLVDRKTLQKRYEETSLQEEVASRIQNHIARERWAR